MTPIAAIDHLVHHAGGNAEFEVMLSKGLGQYFTPTEKTRLFQDAKTISDLLAVVMDRRTQEIKKGGGI